MSAKLPTKEQREQWEKWEKRIQESRGPPLGSGRKRALSETLCQE